MPNRRHIFRAAQRVAALSLSSLLAHAQARAGETWGGSVAISSDYLVRGISRSNHAYAWQADLHAASDLGIIGGLFASTSRFAADDHRDVEIDAFLGYAWASPRNWRLKLLASHYAYPWNAAGSQYDYDEIDLGVTFRDWLDVSVMLSPNSPRFAPYEGLIGVTEKSAEVDVRTPRSHGFSGVAGAGYAVLGGEEGTGYAYWSAGGAYDRPPWSFSVSYVNTSAAARALYYNAAAHDRWSATVILQF